MILFLRHTAHHMKLETFLQQLENSPESITFDSAIALIDTLYEFTSTAFRNGSLLNEAGKNNGSCKIFSFAKLHNLTQQQSLDCFGAYYRQDVLEHPASTDHQNIRNFIQTGWVGIEFFGSALALKGA